MDSVGRLTRVLLCEPEYFHLEPINVISQAHLAKNAKVDAQSCLAEHRELQHAYRENGVKVELVKPRPELPYQVFARDFGGCVAEGYIAGRFREPVRSGELAAYEAKMAELGVPCVARCTSGAFEGGDFWMLDEHTIAHGVIARTDPEGFANVQRQMAELGYSMMSVPCQRANLHLDMCFNIVAPRAAVACLEALPAPFLAALRKRRFELVPIAQEAVFRHCGNIQALGDERVLTFDGNGEVNAKLRALGLKLISIKLESILKGGGGIHCMTFPLERSRAGADSRS
jgi:N-dimethylarginine dimethylaminohydrolase